MVLKTFQIDEEIARKLKIRAAVENVPEVAIIRRLLWKYLNEPAKENKINDESTSPLHGAGSSGRNLVDSLD